MDHDKDDVNGSVQVTKFDMPSCGGCRTCELACSFHHTGEFSPGNSSLKIRDKAEAEEGFHVQLVAQSKSTPVACDGCRERDIPLCVEHCKESDDLHRILVEFEKKKCPPS